MSFLAGLGCREAAVVAADTRHHVLADDSVFDAGGKVVCTDRGWAAFGSWGDDGRPVAPAIHHAALVSGGRPQSMLRDVLDRVNDLEAALYPGGGVEIGGRVLVASKGPDGPELHRFNLEDRKLTRVEGCCLNGPSNAKSHWFRLHTEHMLAASNLPELLRRFARALLRVRERSYQVGPWLHVGAVLQEEPGGPIRYASWFDRAADLVEAGDADLLARAQEIDAPPRAVKHDLDTGIEQTDGLGTLPLSKGLTPGIARHNEAVTYQDDLGVIFNQAPKVQLLSGGLSRSGVLSGEYGPKFQALNADKNGFEPSLVLRESEGTVSEIVEAWSSGGGQDFTAGKSTGNNVIDDEFFYRYHVFISGSQIGGECIGGSMTVGRYVHKGGSWVQTGTSQYSSSCNDYDSDVNALVTESGMEGETGSAVFGITKEFGSGILSTPDSNPSRGVVWDEGAGPNTREATPDGISGVPFVVQSTAS